jgi:hypothetical protein
MTTSRITFQEAMFTPAGPGFSYLAVLVVMALICVVLFRGFRRSGWL